MRMYCTEWNLSTESNRIAPVWNAKLTETRIFRELSIEIENSNWIKELSNSIKELFNSIRELFNSIIELSMYE